MSPGLRVGPGHFGEMTALCGCNRWLAKAAPVLYRTYTPYPSLLQRCLAVPSVEKWSLSLPAAPIFLDLWKAGQVMVWWFRALALRGRDSSAPFPGLLTLP